MNTVTMEQSQQLSTQKLNGENKKIGTRLVKISSLLQSLAGSNNPGAIAETVALTVEQAELVATRLEYSKELIGREEKRQQDRDGDLDRSRDAAIVAGDELQSLMLPFAEEFQNALGGVPDKWAHILELSDRVRLYNQLALNNRRRQICTAHLEPKTLHRLVMHQVRRSLGPDTVIAPLPLFTVEDRESSLVADFDAVLKLEKEVHHNGEA